MKYDNLYPNLVNARKEKYTQEELAKELGITQQEVSRYERGITKAPINFIIDVAKICNVSIDYIVGLSTEIKNCNNNLSEKELNLIEIYRNLNSNNKSKLEERAEMLVELDNQDKNNTKKRDVG